MPNWCHNLLRVSGDDGDLKQFLDNVYDRQAETPLCFRSIAPEPEGLMERPDSGIAGLIDKTLADDHLDWYAWRVRHWGSKWEPNFERPTVAIMTAEAAAREEPPADQAGLIVLDNDAYFSFLTAWSPPIPWVEKAARRYPSLRFSLSWAEPGNDLAGRADLQGEDIEFSEMQVSQVLAPEDRWF